MSRARDVTIAHMQRLVTTATLAGALACNKCNATGTGYGVVDPMPNPARCPAFLGTITATATFVAADAGDQLIELILDTSLAPKDAGVDTKAATISNATILETTPVPKGTRFLLRPSSGVGGITLSVNLTCSEGPAMANINVSWGPEDGAVGIHTNVQIF